MSVLIKGAKMPKACEYCMFAGYGGIANEYYVCMFNGRSKDRYSNGRMESCPLVEIPPHGRLIDADKLENIFWDILNKPDEYDKPLHDMILELQTAPTVIESKEQEHEKESKEKA